MSNLLPRRLRYFVVVAEELSFTRAARRLHISQPSLSVLIRALETEIGVELLLREKRGIRLTEAGRVFLGQARKMLADASSGIEVTRRAASGEVGTLCIGYNNPAGFRILPTLIPAFRRARPDVHLTFHDLRIPQQIEKLRRGELDVGFVWLPAPTEEFEVRRLISEPLIVVLPARHALASQRALALQELSAVPLVMMERALDPSSFRQIEQSFEESGATMNVVYQLETLLSIINFVAMGSGCSILPAYVQSIPRAGVVYRPLKPHAITKTLAILKRKDRDGAAEFFFSFAASHRYPRTRERS